MATVVSINKAKIILSQLVKRAAAGETILIGSYDRARAKLVSANDSPPIRKKIIGAMKGEFEVPDDFDAPLPDEVLNAFEGN